MKQTPIVVLRSNDICFLGILRSLGQLNLNVIPVVFTWEGAGTWHSERSVFFRDPISIANPFEFPELAQTQFQSILKKLHDKYGKKILTIPSSDTNLVFLLENYPTFEPYIKLIGPQGFDGNPSLITHKGLCSRHLSSKGLPVPSTVDIENERDWKESLKDLDYPVVLKPSVKDYGQSFYKRNLGSKAISCEDYAQAIENVLREVKHSDKLVVQEKIKFNSAQDEIPFYVYADKNSKVVLASAAVKEVIHPHPFGTAVVLKLIIKPELDLIAQNIVSALNWHGPLMIEFIRDQKDGKWKIIELNGRPWLLIDFFRQHGFNYLELLARDYLNLSRGANQETSHITEIHGPTQVILKEFAAAHISKKPEMTLDEFIEQLAKVDRPISWTYFTEDDKEPGYSELNELCSVTQWNIEELKQGLNELNPELRI